jgi:hypothetical protein
MKDRRREFNFSRQKQSRKISFCLKTKEEKKKRRVYKKV